MWNIVVLIIGLARAHETSEGKAAAAVLVPVGLCCLFLLLVFVIFGIAVLAAIAGLSQELHR